MELSLLFHFLLTTSMLAITFSFCVSALDIKYVEHVLVCTHVCCCTLACIITPSLKKTLVLDGKYLLLVLFIFTPYQLVKCNGLALKLRCHGDGGLLVIQFLCILGRFKNEKVN